MIEAIYLPEKSISTFTTESTKESLLGLSHLNVFIGTNNSGKSRFIRYLFSDEEHVNFISSFDEDEQSFNRDVIKYKSLFKIIATKGNRYAKGIILESRIESKFNFEDVDSIDSLLKIAYNLLSIKSEDFKHPDSYNSATLKSLKIKFRSLGSDIYNYALKFENIRIKRLYIPILRGLRPIQYNGDNFKNDDNYSKRTLFDYFKNNLRDSSKAIFTGLSIYEDIKKLLLGDENNRALIAGFEKFLEATIFEEKVTLIPKYNEDVLNIKIGSNRQRPIFDLGDGLQTLISIFFPIFVRKDESLLVFIEEPESHLHPKWQTLLANALQNFTKHSFFISTHSSAFINNEDTSVYRVEKSNNLSRIKRLEFDKQKSGLLLELGYKPSDLLQTNYILWVEGPSDKIYLNYWISIVDDTLVEGIHYSIMFLGGDNFKHVLNDNDFEILSRLNQNFGLVLDSDKTSKDSIISDNKKNIQNQFNEKGLFCWITNFRMIENYVPMTDFENAIKAVHKRDNIEIPDGDYDNRNKIVDRDITPSLKSRIKLPQKIFQVIQKNGNGSTEGIDARILRKEVESAIKRTQSQYFSVDKIRIAQQIVSMQTRMENPELKNKIGELVEKIKRANQLD